jgi:serine/threonine protein kinase
VLAGALIDGQFRLHHQIGEGGMGTVWAAEDLRLGRMVAAKFLSKHLATQPRVRERFQREARMTARVRSTHVVQVFAEGCTADDVPYLIMELLLGDDLAVHLQRGGRFELSETVPIVEQICRGLAQAHAQGLVHRDIKPHNIFLAKGDTDEDRAVVKLLDFGIAKDLASLRDSLTACGEVVGSALYCSPEQLRDPQSVDRATDVWAIGVVIFEMLTGRVPYEANTLSELIDRHRDGPSPRVSSLVAALPRELDAFFERTLHNTASKRWSSVEELAGEYSAIVQTHCAMSERSVAQTLGSTTLIGAQPIVLERAPVRSAAGSLRSVFVALILTLLACVGALTWTQLAADAASQRLRERVIRASVPWPPSTRSDSASAPAELTAPPPQSTVTQPPAPDPAVELPAMPQPKAAVPRSRSAAKRSHPAEPVPAALPAQHNGANAPQTELPGRNHGF